MTDRTTSSTVVFERPFRLDGVEGLYPPGSYVVETHEELIQGLSFAAYRRVGTFIALPLSRGASAGRQIVSIGPDELEAALVRDKRDEPELGT
jgi:hypothetical protein